MSIRRLFIVTLAVINLLALVGLLVYVGSEDSAARQVRAERRRLMELTREQLRHGPLDEAGRRLLLHFTQVVEATLHRMLANETASPLTEEGRELSLLLAVRELPILEDPAFVALVEHAVLLRLPPRRTLSGLSPGDPFPRWFNLRRRLIFPEALNEQSEPREFVALALASGEFYGEGRAIAGPLKLRGEPWGGFYVLLRGPAVGISERIDPGVNPFTVLLLLAPAFLLGPIVTWRLLSQRVIAPLEQIGAIAEEVAAGDYGTRLQIKATDDEVARTMRLLNAMLDLVQGYRDHLEDRVQEKTAELERRHVELRLAQRLAATGTLAAGIAHEINNPLAGMVNLVSRLKRSDLDPSRREQYLAVLEENIERIGAIVRRVLEISPRKMVPSPVDLSRVVRATIDLVSHRARERGVAIESELGSLPVMVLGESNELGQVLLNLLINALDASVSGGVVWVRLEPNCEGGHALIIQDEGEGMDEETRERAFDLFFTTKGPKGGTGLGLALVRGIIEGHEGQISLLNGPERGTIARVWLPAFLPKIEAT